VLSEGGRRQVLYSADGFVDEAHLDVVWAGDLDRDGQRSRRSDRDKLIRFPKRSGMLSSLGSVVLVLIPAYLVYRVWQQYVYTKSLETRLNERN
jgi:hypothetical protein